MMKPLILIDEAEQDVADAYDWYEQRTGLGDDCLVAMGSPDIQNTVVEPYHKGGFRLGFDVEHGELAWNDLIVDVLALAQRGAHGWLLSGNIHEDPSGCSTEVSHAGATALQWLLQRTPPPSPQPPTPPSAWTSPWTG